MVIEPGTLAEIRTKEAENAGRIIGAKQVFNINVGDMMVGREMGQEYPKEVGNIGDTILEVKNLVRSGVLKDISFNVHSGEVFGISGLVGAGRTELARAILGIDRIDSGEVFIRGKQVHYHTFADAIRDGLGLIPEDRKLEGLVQIMSVKKNITMEAAYRSNDEKCVIDL